jgi:hypothetical protein
MSGQYDRHTSNGTVEAVAVMRSWSMAILNLLRHDSGECSEHRVSHIEEVKLLRQGTTNHSTV